jgi:signal transduction histidine kinase
MVADIQRLRIVEQKAHHDQQLASVGKLAAKLAHDINNPLTVIANVTRLLLKQTAADPASRDDLATILKNCERCTNIAQNLLRFSRPLHLKMVPSDLGQVCNEAADHSRHRLPGLQVELRRPTSPIMLTVDPFQLGRVLDNLINNAFQACPEEPIVLECGIASGRAYVAVIDQGKGFSTEAIDHLFEPFFTTKPEGSGLGLASCLAVARAHGGDLQVTSPDKGHVTLWLPLPVQEAR